MLVKLILEFLFNLYFWTYLSFDLFTMCLVPLLSFQINAAWIHPLISDSKVPLLIQKYLDEPCHVS